jgi:hypothetical protein
MRYWPIFLLAAAYRAKIRTFHIRLVPIENAPELELRGASVKKED